MPTNIVVLKFGSSVLRNPADVPTAVHEVYRWYREGSRLLVVVSAVGDSTDVLLASARALDPVPDEHATAELLATGERASAALMGIALERAGIPARIIDPRDIALTVKGSPLDSELSSVNAARVHLLLMQTPVVVISGFFGYAEDGRIHLLGRGGTDLTAVFLANGLDAGRCRLIKDVDGVYESDPAVCGAGGPGAPRRFASLTYGEAIACASQLVQPKAVHFLEKHQRSAEVAAIGKAHASVIAGGPSKKAAPPAPRGPTKVALMGLGTVGSGVYQRLLAMPDEFSVRAILVRDPPTHHARGVAKEILHADLAAFAKAIAPNDTRGGVDVVVDVLPGSEPSTRLVEAFVHAGMPVVTANKAMMAEVGPKLAFLSEGLFASATVGGSTPMIEAVRRAAHGEAGIRAIAGVLSGTCNYLLNRAADGLPFPDAVHEAQQLGLAETNPSEDLSGRDAARKLRILVRLAFGHDVELDRIDVDAIDEGAFARARQARASGKVLRLVAAASGHGRGSARVRLESLDVQHELANLPGAWNRLVIERMAGERTTVTGRGAGRWPTTEAVIADLFELRRQGSQWV
jgi:homoserine dehydrogenase